MAPSRSSAPLAWSKITTSADWAPRENGDSELWNTRPGKRLQKTMEIAIFSTAFGGFNHLEKY
jgi:hypothetical protein